MRDSVTMRNDGIPAELFWPICEMMRDFFFPSAVDGCLELMGRWMKLKTVMMCVVEVEPRRRQLLKLGVLFFLKAANVSHSLNVKM